MELFKLTNWKRNIFKAKLFSHSDSVRGCSAEKHNMHDINRNEITLCLNMLTDQSTLTKQEMISTHGIPSRLSLLFFFSKCSVCRSQNYCPSSRLRRFYVETQVTSLSVQNRSKLYGKIPIHFLRSSLS